MPTNTPEGPKPTETPEPPEPTETPEPSPTPTDQGTFDIDIREFSVSEEAQVGKGKPVYIKVNIRNSSKVEGMGSATVIGVQNGVEIYRQTLPVAMDAESRSRWFAFMSYTPLQKGKIIWTVTLQDNDPDTDLKTAVTKVEGKDDDDDDRHGGDNDHD